MKILYITASYPFGKGEGFLTQEIIQLASLGCYLDILATFPRGEFYYHEIDNLHGINLISPRVMTLSQLVNFFLFVFFHPIKFLKALMLTLSMNQYHFWRNCLAVCRAAAVAKQIKKLKVDHLFCHWSTTPSTIGMVLSEWLQVPFSMTCHRGDIVLNNLLALKCLKAYMTRFISQHGLEIANRLGADTANSIVIPMGVKIDESIAPKPYPNRHGNNFCILCPANLLPVKGHKYLLSALPEVIEHWPNIRMLIAGEGILKTELQTQVNHLQLQKNVHFLGHVSHQELMNMYKSNEIDLVVLPSILTDDGEHEGIPVSLMEAMSYAIPVISTNTGAINELLPISLAWTVPDKNSTELAKKIIYFLENAERYSTLSETSLKIIRENWTSACSAKKILSELTKYSVPESIR